MSWTVIDGLGDRKHLLHGADDGRGFWEKPPVSDGDPAVLQQYGIACTTRKNGRGAIAAGSALCRTAGLHRHQAADFIVDGFTEWRSELRYSPAEGVEFLENTSPGCCRKRPRSPATCLAHRRRSPRTTASSPRSANGSSRTPTAPDAPT